MCPGCSSRTVCSPRTPVASCPQPSSRPSSQARPAGSVSAGCPPPTNTRHTQSTPPGHPQTPAPSSKRQGLPRYLTRESSTRTQCHHPQPDPPSAPTPPRPQPGSTPRHPRQAPRRCRSPCRASPLPQAATSRTPAGLRPRPSSCPPSSQPTARSACPRRHGPRSTRRTASNAPRPKTQTRSRPHSRSPSTSPKLAESGRRCPSAPTLARPMARRRCSQQPQTRSRHPRSASHSR
mmetsp:Transcript_24561/g.85380  ORF Transcript_24561/g.85380 Transcript_24561/m.85380 type:complete len:235 (-) Transcript_24561:284-988(-)